MRINHAVAVVGVAFLIYQVPVASWAECDPDRRGGIVEFQHNFYAARTVLVAGPLDGGLRTICEANTNWPRFIRMDYSNSFLGSDSFEYKGSMFHRNTPHGHRQGSGQLFIFRIK